MPVYVDLKQGALRQFYRRWYWFQRSSMNQKLLLFVTVIIFVGIIIFYRSRSTTNSLTIVYGNPVHVEFFVMSKCPDARRCELLFAPALLKLSSIINFTVSYIAYEKNSNQISCMHGPDECLGNKQQLCVQNMCSQTTLIKFLQCQSKSLEQIPTNGEDCVKQASEGSLEWSDIDNCVKSTKADDLLRKSIQRTRAAGARKSCTMHLNGKFWCMHDGSWYDCSEGRDEASLIKAICSRYTGAHKPTECTS